MLHEVLLCLIGHEGALVDFSTGEEEEEGCENDEENRRLQDEQDMLGKIVKQRFESGQFARMKKKPGPRVRNSVKGNVLTEAEALSIEELAKAGWWHRKLRKFVDSNRGLNGNSLSLVREAGLNGIEEILDWHHGLVCDIERAALADKGMPLSKVRVLHGDSTTVLEAIYEMCAESMKSNRKGGQIIERINRGILRCGVESISKRLETVLKQCVKVFLNMIETWMVHGILHDPAQEFFIQERLHEVSTSSVPLDDESDTVQNPLIAEYEWKSQFSLRYTMLPQALISEDLAKKILFVGKAVRVLQRSQFFTKQSRQDSFKPLETFLEGMQKVKQAEMVDKINIACTIREYYFVIAGELQNLVVNKSQLVEHLDFVRNFFLLGHGAFYTSFITLGQNMFATSPSSSLATAKAAFNSGPWREAAEQLGLTEMDQFSKLCLVLTRSRIDFRSGFSGTENAALSSDTASIGSFRSRRSTNLAQELQRNDLRDLVFVGKGSFEGNAIEFPSGYGGVWYGPKMKVEKEFEASVTVRNHRNATSKGLSQTAICFHHDTMVGPTALSSQSSRDGDVLLGNAHAMLQNAVSFVFEISGDFNAIRVHVQHGGRSVFASKEIVIGYSLDMREVLHRFEVGRKENVFRLRVMDKSNLVIAEEIAKLDFSGHLTLERGSNRAWVGLLLSSSVGEKAQQGQSAEIVAWYYNSQGPTDRAKGEFDPWRSLLNLHLDVDWPLHLILTQNSLDQYRMMFRFLLSVRRVEHSLKETWAILNQTKFKATWNNTAEDNQRLMQLWRLRSSMAYLLNNLLFHLQIDVIDSLQERMKEQIQDASDFGAVARAHRAFIDNLITKSFLHKAQVREHIDIVLRKCLRFTSLVGNFVVRHERNEDMTDIDKALNEVAQSYTQEANFLFYIVSNDDTNVPLRTRIDFNGHFSKLRARQVGYSRTKLS